jgi:hypothetical protein
MPASVARPVDALGARHAGIGAGGAHGQAALGREEPVQQQLGPHHDQQHQRAGHVVGHPFRLQDGEDGRLVISGTLGAPMTRRLIEYSAIIIRILASRSMIFRRTLSQPVMKPASAPASSATRWPGKG